MGLLNTKIGKILSRDYITFFICKMDAKLRKLKLQKHNKYVQMVCDIHSSSIPNQIRTSEIPFEFNTDFSDLEMIPLDKKVKSFLKWYYKKWIKGHYTYVGELYGQKRIINFIEKMVSWYEMKYPDFEVNRFMTGTSIHNKSIDDILLNKGVDSIKWKNLLDYHTFVLTLSEEEKGYLQDPIFRSSYCMKDAYMGFLHITKDGIVKTDEVRFDISEYYHGMTLGKSLYVTDDFDNLNLLQVKLLMEKYNMLNDVIGIQKIIDDYQLQIETKERLLDCVMYRIIERGGNKIGAFRAFLFAKEFNRNARIPMMYSTDDPHFSLEKILSETSFEKGPVLTKVIK